MIVTAETPRYEGMTVEEAGPLLPEADIIDVYSTGLKITLTGTLTFDDEHVQLAFDTISGASRRAYLTPAEAEHLAQLLVTHAQRARHAAADRA